MVTSIYCRLSLRKYIKIHSDLTFLLYNVWGFTFFYRIQCIIMIYNVIYLSSIAGSKPVYYNSGALKIKFLL